MDIDKLSLEQTFELLEGTVVRLESEEITLEESFAAYEEGMRLLKHCNDSIDRVEKQVLMLSSEGECVPFSQEESMTESKEQRG